MVCLPIGKAISQRAMVCLPIGKAISQRAMVCLPIGKAINDMLLESINTPRDFKKLKVHQLNLLCAELRSRIVQVVSKNGGHLASSLGAVEIITALHYCLNLPEDMIVFDVGHQAYAHKLLTGRNNRFDTLRKAGGMSGFPSHTESTYDPFTAGHRSDAVSLALGLAAGGCPKAEK